MKALRYIILILFLWNIPSVFLEFVNTSLASLLSYVSFALLIVYYFLSKKNKTATIFLLFFILYYCISGLVFVSVEKLFFTDFFKLIVLVFFGGEVARNASFKEILILLLIGASSIFLNALFFSSGYDNRYSGFYLDPNAAGFICCMGCALSYHLKSIKWRLSYLSLFTFFGIFTFSRTFFIIWFVMVIIAIIHNYKNIQILALGFFAFTIFLGMSKSFELDSDRLSMIESVFINGTVTNKVNEDSRTKTWAMYYKKIADRPIFGNGYKTLSGSDTVYDDGVHNNFLRILGESGIFPFFIYLFIHLFLIFKSIKVFRSSIHLILLANALFLTNLTNHNFDTLYYVTIITLWLYFKLITTKTLENKTILV